MKQKENDSLASLIAEVKSQLKWPIRPEPSVSDLEIRCNPEAKEHIFYVPVLGVTEIALLHELAHATLGERVHHLVATASFGVELTHDELYFPTLLAAEWFADGLLMQWSPNQAEDRLREKIQRIRGRAIRDKTEALYMRGWAFALEQHYLGVQSLPPERLQPVVKAFLGVPPDQPSLEAMTSLVNELAAIISPYRVEVIKVDGLELWGVTTATLLRE